MNYKFIGKNIKKFDTTKAVTGELKYTGDFYNSDMLYGKLLLSEKPHATFEFDFEEALKVDGIFKILTAEDLPDVPYNSMEWFSGINATKNERLLNSEAKCVGDRIALVLGDNKECVEEALKRIVVNYTELPTVLGLKQARENKICVHGDSNIAYEKEIARGDYNSIKDEAYMIVEDTGTTPRTHHLAIEPHIAEGYMQGNILTVSSPSQVVYAIQMQLSRILSLPVSNIRVIKSTMGGSFGGKQMPLLELIAGAVAYKFNRHVQIYMDREQAIIGTFTRNSTEINVKTAVDKSGKILGRFVDLSVDGGAYDTNNTSITNAFAKKIFRLYDIPNQNFHGTAYYTNAIPGGACRAYGGPQAHAITEINITNTAEKLGMDPCEFRIKNLLAPHSEDGVGGPNIGNAGIKQCIEVGMKKFNWYEKYKNIHLKNTERYAYGVGMACATHGNGYVGAFPDFTNVELVLNFDGSVLAKIAIHEQGCGTITSLTQMLAEALDIEIEKIHMPEADTFFTPYDSAGTQASRVTFVNGGALKKAGEALRLKLIETVSKIENIEIDRIYSDLGKIKVKDSDIEYTYAELAILREKMYADQTSVYVHHAPDKNPAAFAAAFVEVKVDKYTGIVEIEDLLAVHDIGKAVNPELVAGQIHGGCQFILGMALNEEVVIDKNGYVPSKTLSKYHILNSQDMPKVRIELIETEDEFSPYGIKSVGEVSAVAPGPATINAINNALETNITNYPANPERIIKALELKAKGV